MTVTHESVERHRAPALWVVVAAIAVACAVAVTVGARPAVLLLAVTLAVAALARLVGRGRSPEGIAVRSTWLDVVILTGLALAMGVLAFAPGV